MSHFAAVLDANVLHAYPLTSVLLELAEARMFRPVWTAEIHAEWLQSVCNARPEIPREKLERRRVAMDTALPDACVDGYQKLIPSLDLPDPNDRQVLAAAIRAKAQVIVTFNERDFPEAILAEFDICAQHPDTFLCHLIDLAPNIVRTRMTTLVEGLKNPAMSIDEYIAMLERLALPETAAALRGLFAEG